MNKQYLIRLTYQGQRYWFSGGVLPVFYISPKYACSFDSTERAEMWYHWIADRVVEIEGYRYGDHYARRDDLEIVDFPVFD